MIDRRQHRRFVLDPPLTGELQISVDVTLDGLDERAATIVTRTPGLTSQPIVLRLMMRGGRVHTMTVRAIESIPVSVDGVISRSLYCERVEDVADLAQAWGGVPPRVEDVLTSVAVRTMPAHVLQVSANGCLLETPLSVDRVKFARLDLELPLGEQYSAMLRICRPGSRVSGSGKSHVAAEFVPLYESSRLSIQQFVSTRLNLYALES